MAETSCVMTELCLERETEPRRALENHESASRARGELLKAFVEGMNSSGIEYCLLSGVHGYPEATDSDVDFMVSPEDIARVEPLLQEVATGCGARLVQAMRHETEACYFVLTKQVGSAIAFLHPDCTADYRRNGRLWMTAAPLLQKRRRYKEFFLPAVADEFQYYLIKKVLKQNLGDAELARLRALYLSDPEGCCNRVRRCCSRRTSGKLVAALMRHDLAWIRSQLPSLLAELYRTDPLENWLRRGIQRLREGRRWVRRIANPTGLSIGVCGGNAKNRADVAAALERNLRPAFRRTKIIEEGEGGGWLDLSLWLSKVRSTLVIRKRETVRRGTLSRNELCFELGGATERSVDFIVREVLEWMAGRQWCRMKMNAAGSPRSQAMADTECDA